MNAGEQGGGHKAATDRRPQSRKGDGPSRPGDGDGHDVDGRTLSFSSGELRAPGHNGAQTSVESRRALYE